MNTVENKTAAPSFGSFTISRLLKASPERVFAAWTTPEGKQAWFVAPNAEWKEVERRFDFRVGGTEILAGRWASGLVTRFDCTYRDIVPKQRVVYVYDMWLDERKISVSLATIDIRAEGDGTRMVVTEQGAFLDGYEDQGSRERGTNALMDQLQKSLEQ
jgi:uncharacterized protein YndB with AHSA1/START domain